MTQSEAMRPVDRVEIPAGMVEWHGGEAAPDDWDRKGVLVRCGELVAHVSDWSHYGLWNDIIAYTPRTPVTPPVDDRLMQEVGTALFGEGGPLAKYDTPGNASPDARARADAAATPFRRGHGGKYDRDHAALVSAFIAFADAEVTRALATAEPSPDDRAQALEVLRQHQDAAGWMTRGKGLDLNAVCADAMLAYTDDLRAELATATARVAEAVVEQEKSEAETYEIGKRDGYADAIQWVDQHTGGDGEYFASTLPGRGCPGPVEMRERIVERFQALEEALDPFVQALSDWGDEPGRSEYRDAAEIWEGAVAMNITYGDLRRAATVHARKEPRA